MSSKYSMKVLDDGGLSLEVDQRVYPHNYAYCALQIVLQILRRARKEGQLREVASSMRDGVSGMRDDLRINLDAYSTALTVTDFAEGTLSMGKRTTVTSTGSSPNAEFVLALALGKYALEKKPEGDHIMAGYASACLGLMQNYILNAAQSGKLTQGQSLTFRTKR